MDIAVVIVNFRTPDLVIDCVASLERARGAAAFEVFIVENGSGDDSQARLQQAIGQEGWSTWVKLLPSSKNLGFAGGNNLAIRALLTSTVRPKYMLLLNSDTLVNPRTLNSCLSIMEQDKTLGMMSCQVLNADGTLQNVTRRFPAPLKILACAFGLPWILPRLFGWANVNETSEALLRQKRDCDWIGGAFMFIRTAALAQLGPLDEDFFFYGEDIEFCHRFRKAGCRIHYDPAAGSITHLGGASSDPTRLPSKARTAHAWHARYLVQRKCYGAWAAWLLRAADIAALGLRKLRLACRGKRAGEDYQTVSSVLGMLMRPLKV